MYDPPWGLVGRALPQLSAYGKNTSVEFIPLTGFISLCWADIYRRAVFFV